MKQDWINSCTTIFNQYVDSFRELSEEQKNNFNIKKEHSLRVSELVRFLAQKLDLPENESKIAFVSGVFHDIGRFGQLIEFNTFDDSKSVDHAEFGIEILKKEGFIKEVGIEDEELIYTAILWHNKLELPNKLTDRELLHAKLLRDADKLDILRVLSEYYSQRNSKPNHTLTWELPKGTNVSDTVARDILAGKLVSKHNVVSELDVKIMQLSWVYDLNFKSSIDFLLANRFFDRIYNSMPKNDLVIGIYRKVKVFAENKLLA